MRSIFNKPLGKADFMEMLERCLEAARYYRRAEIRYAARTTGEDGRALAAKVGETRSRFDAAMSAAAELLRKARMDDVIAKGETRKGGD